MAPSHGATGQLPKSFGSRPIYKPVVPVVPITFPQRATKPRAPVAAPAAPVISVETHRQPVDKASEEKVEQTMETAQQASREHDLLNGAPKQESELVSAGASAATQTPPSSAPAQADDTPLVPPATHTDKPLASTDGTTTTSSTKYRQPTSSSRTAKAALPTVPALPSNSTAFARPPDVSTFPAMQPAMMDRFPGHQPHPSNGSLVFGGFNASSNSSPAPHLSAGFPPPSPTVVHYPPVHAIPVDMYGRPIMVSPTAGNGFAHNPLNNRGPPTPHSFHGSQSSAQVDETNGFGSHAMADHGSYPPELPGHTQPYVNAHVPFINHKIQDQALAMLRNAFKSSEYSDCTLEFRFEYPYKDTRDPLKMSVHRFVVAHSPTLRQLLRTRPVTDGVLEVNIYDEFIRTDALYFAIRTLYGWDLGDGPHLPSYIPLANMTEDLSLALGYIASARYLQLPLVHLKGVHWASRLVGWETIELACKFALPIAALLPPSRHALAHRDEYGISELLDSITAFLFSSIPLDFVLDTAAGDCGFARLPLIASAPPTPPSPNVPAIAHGTSHPNSKTHMPRNHRASANLRLSNIQFGDLSLSAGEDGAAAEPAVSSAPRRPPTHSETVLSRVLLNLPFAMLKQVLEHPAFAKNQTAEPITRAIVAERELRRLRAMDKHNTDLRFLQETVERSDKPLQVAQMGDFLVNSMGFKEEVFMGDAPYLVQTWTAGSGSAGSVSSA